MLFIFSAFNCPANLASHRRWHKPRPATHPATNHQGVKSMKLSPLSTGCVEKENQSVSKQIGVLSPAFKIDIWFLHQLVACNFVVDIFYTNQLIVDIFSWWQCICLHCILYLEQHMYRILSSGTWTITLPMISS